MEPSQSLPNGAGIGSCNNSGRVYGFRDDLLRCVSDADNPAYAEVVTHGFSWPGGIPVRPVG